MAEVTAQDVADFLGQGDDTQLVALAEEHVALVTAMARAYTRGRGFSDGSTSPAGIAEDVAAVITTATARLVTNPEQNKREQLHDYSVTPTPFVGWSLVELFVLNRYRRRSA